LGLSEEIREVNCKINSLESKNTDREKQAKENKECINKLSQDFENKLATVQRNVSSMVDDLKDKQYVYSPRCHPYSPQTNYHFGDYQKNNPTEFLSKLELEYKCNGSPASWKFLVESRLEGKAYLWWSLENSKLDSFDQFSSAFKLKFCGPEFNRFVMDKLRLGGYYSTRQGSAIEYITHLLKLAQAADLIKDEKEITKLISSHFNKHIYETVCLKDYSTINELISYLENIPDVRVLFKESFQNSYNKDRQDIPSNSQHQYNKPKPMHTNPYNHRNYNRSPTKQVKKYYNNKPMHNVQVLSRNENVNSSPISSESPNTFQLHKTPSAGSHLDDNAITVEHD